MRTPFRVGRHTAVKTTLCVSGLTLLALAPSAARAQGSIPPPDINGFAQTGWHAQMSKDPYPGYHGMTPPAAAAHGFFLSQARLYFTGQVDDSFGYVIQTNLAGGTALLTAYLTWDLNREWQLRAGQMLKPFGRDRTRARHLLVTLDRSVGSNLLVSANNYGSWDVGAMVQYHPDGGMTFQGGCTTGVRWASRPTTTTGRTTSLVLCSRWGPWRSA